jgi:hypothetical protein
VIHEENLGKLAILFRNSRRLPWGSLLAVCNRIVSTKPSLRVSLHGKRKCGRLRERPRGRLHSHSTGTGRVMEFLGDDFRRSIELLELQECRVEE